jgi:hypothetical protein
MYFTRNNYLNGKSKKTADVILLKLYKATNENGKCKCTRITFNSNEYSVAHPKSVDEKTLYFASDMPGTKGLSDLLK